MAWRPFSACPRRSPPAPSSRAPTWATRCRRFRRPRCGPEPGRRGHDRRAHPGDGMDRRPFVRALPRGVLRPWTDGGDVVGRHRHPSRTGHARSGVHDLALNLLPIVLLVVLALKKVPPFLAIFGTAVLGRTCVRSPNPTWSRRSWTSPDRAPSSTASKPCTRPWRPGLSRRAATRRSTGSSRWRHGEHAHDGLAILGALSFAAIMEHAGFLDRLIAPARRAGEVGGGADRDRGRDMRRPQRRRRRPVRGGCPAQPSLPRGVRYARVSPPGCCPAPSKTPAQSRRCSSPGTAAAPT